MMEYAYETWRSLAFETQSLEFAANNTRNRSINIHAIVDEHFNGTLLVLSEFRLNYSHIVSVTLFWLLLFHLESFLLMKINKLVKKELGYQNGGSIFSVNIRSCSYGYLPEQSWYQVLLGVHGVPALQHARCALEWSKASLSSSA